MASAFGYIGKTIAPRIFFFAEYGEHEILIKIEDLSIYAGHLPSRAFGLVVEWASLHRAELLENWELMKANEPLRKIEPLP